MEWPVFDKSHLKSEIESDSQFCVVTAYTDTISSWQKLGDLTSSTKESYCRMHGYGFRAYTKGFDPARPASWSKLLFLKDTLRTYQWVFWTDADVAITNPGVELERFVREGDIVMGHHHDCKGGYALNMGVFMLRGGEFSDWLFQALWNAKHCIHHHWWEQKAFIELADKGMLGHHLRVVRVREQDPDNPGFNMTHDTWKPGDFILHAGGMGVLRRLEIFQRSLSMGTGDRTPSGGSERALEGV